MRFRDTGAERKAKAPKVRKTILEWFIDARETLKGSIVKKYILVKVPEGLYIVA